MITVRVPQFDGPLDILPPGWLISLPDHFYRKNLYFKHDGSQLEIDGRFLHISLAFKDAPLAQGVADESYAVTHRTD